MGSVVPAACLAGCYLFPTDKHQHDVRDQTADLPAERQPLHLLSCRSSSSERPVTFDLQAGLRPAALCCCVSIFELWLTISPPVGPLSLVLPAEGRWRTEDGHVVVHSLDSERSADLLLADPMFRWLHLLNQPHHHSEPKPGPVQTHGSEPSITVED